VSMVWCKHGFSNEDRISILKDVRFKGRGVKELITELLNKV